MSEKHFSKSWWNTKTQLCISVGETTNLMSLDAQRFMDLVPFLNMAWTSPLGIMLCMYFLWGILGPSSLAGLAVMVLMIPLNAIVASKMRKYQINQVRRRIEIIQECPAPTIKIFKRLELRYFWGVLASFTT